MSTPTPLKRFTAQFLGVAEGPWFNEIIDRVNGLVSGSLQLAASVFSLAYADVLVGIVAFAGGGKASATPLTHLVNGVDTVATAADSVLLPAPTKVGQVVIVFFGAFIPYIGAPLAMLLAAAVAVLQITIQLSQQAMV
mgnify:CR=1 FL=1